MGRFSSADIGFVLISGQDILGDTTNLEDNREALLEEVTALGDDWEAHAAIGVKRFHLTQQGFFNDAANRSNAALLTPGTSKVISYAPEGNVLGNKVVCAQGVQVDYARQISRGALHKANAQYEATGQQDECLILFPLGAITADGDSTGTPLDNSASSANGAIAYLQVTALDLDGYDSVTITIIDDADNAGSYGTLQAFTTVTAIGAERIAIAGTVERYVAVDIAFVGTGTSPSVTFTVGLRRL